MALYRENGTEIADQAAFEALTQPANTDPPLRLTEPVYETFDYPSSTDTSAPGAAESASTGRRLKYPAGAEVPTSEVAALFA